MKLQHRIALGLCGAIIISEFNEADMKSIKSIEPHSEINTVNEYPRPNLEAQVAGMTISGDAVLF